MLTRYLRAGYWLLSSLMINIHILTMSAVLGMLGIMTRARADKILRQWAVRLLNCAGIRRTIVTHGKLQLNPKQAYIIMSNHSSLFDIPLIFEALPGSIRMLAKKELFSIPLFGHVLKNNEFIAIDRHHSRQAAQALANAKEKMEDGIIVWCAPEGTRSTDGNLQKFKKGVFSLAISTKATIIPVAIYGASKILPNKSLNVNLNQAVTTHIGPTINTDSYTDNNNQQLLTKVETIIKQLLTNNAGNNLRIET